MAVAKLYSCPLISLRRKGMRLAYRTAVWLGMSLTLTGCLNKLDTRSIEREIEAEIESQSRRLSLTEVRCPRDVYKQSGAYFRCVGYLRPEGEFTINVMQQDSEGRVEWDVPNSQVILNMAKVESKLQEEFAKAFTKRATLNCGEMYRINQPGEEIECQVVGKVTLDQGAVTAVLVKVDPEGNLNWYEVRESSAPQASTPAKPNPSSGGNATGAAATTAGATPTGQAPATAPANGSATPTNAGGGVAGSRNIKPPVNAP